MQFLSLTRTGRYVYVNSSAISLLGYSKEELLAFTIADISPKDKIEEYSLVFSHLLETGSVYAELELVKKDGHSILTDLNAVLLPNKMIHASCRDITERKRTEKELLEAKEKAEESDRLKSAFLANMSHEIRTPMNGILGFTELLLEPDLSSEQKEAYINIVSQSGQRMLNTVNDIIEISKIEAGLVINDLKEVDVQVRLDELIRFFISEATKKGLKLILEKEVPKTDATIITDPNKLDSILTNLIKNAIKYTPAGEIRVGCEVIANNLEFYVKDTGIGIPKERQQAVFERFVQAEIGNTRTFEGSGLGLAISKSYVEMLGGKIWVESEEGKGSTVYFTLPLSEQAQENTEEKETGKQDYKISQIKGLNIIIAEDEENSALFLQTILKKESNKILLTKNGHETVEACRINPDTDLVLMDIQMPEMNGYDATREIRKFNKNVLIIAQTAFALTGDYEKAMDAGCNDYISKPINKGTLLAKIQKYISV
ncbi:MAG: ATP-binding protein [Bacteroidota bacterium]|nr:ATP-binding protein [Bacteroidota bacterium]